jgi:hypothetical protein
VKVEFSNRHLSINVVDRGDEQAEIIQKTACLLFLHFYICKIMHFWFLHAKCVQVKRFLMNVLLKEVSSILNFV